MVAAAVEAADGYDEGGVLTAAFRFARYPVSLTAFMDPPPGANDFLGPLEAEEPDMELR